MVAIVRPTLGLPAIMEETEMLIPHLSFFKFLVQSEAAESAKTEAPSIVGIESNPMARMGFHRERTTAVG